MLYPLKSLRKNDQPISNEHLCCSDCGTEISILTSRLLEEMTNSRSGKELYKMNLELRVISDSKKAIKDSGVHVKKLPLAKKWDNLSSKLDNNLNGLKHSKYA